MSATAKSQDDGDRCRTSSASLRIAGVDRPLRGEGPFVRGPRFAAGNIGRNQAERMKAQVRGFLLRLQRDEAHLVRLAYHFQRPSNAGIARQAHAAIWLPLKGGHDDGHRSPHLRLGSYAWDSAQI